ncbi:MAG: dual specificity protein phosphatase family protein [Deltaproteobacteria bacterium]|nr:MAG: dual specificity protein phosphatase family protein [Deltaproteobacteria bacterium]
MTEYSISWLTESIGLGHAPMSHGEMESVREQGIHAIVNLCGEFCNLHEIQKEYDFEVYYLPTCDNEVPSMDELEKALDWLDEAIYLGKKVLVHCRFGIGRTATFVMAYLLRKGYGLKVARKKVEEARAVSSSFSQWRLLKKYHREAGTLAIRQPSLDNGPIVELHPFFRDYETLLNLIDHAFQKATATNGNLLSCGRESEECCYRLVDLQFIEAAYLNHKMSLHLTSIERKEAIERAVEVSKKIGELEKRLRTGGVNTKNDSPKLADSYAQEKIKCPLNVNSKCTIYPIRPTVCRLYGLPVSYEDKVKIFGDQGKEATAEGAKLDYDQVAAVLAKTSENLLHTLTTSDVAESRLTFTLPDAVSGRFVQKYFEYLISSK